MQAIQYLLMILIKPFPIKVNKNIAHPCLLLQATKEVEDNCDERHSKIKIRIKNKKSNKSADSPSLRHQTEEEWDSEAPHNEDNDDLEYKPKVKSSTVKPVRTLKTPLINATPDFFPSIFHVQWNAEIRMSDNPTMPKSERSIVRTDHSLDFSCSGLVFFIQS